MHVIMAVAYASRLKKCHGKIYVIGWHDMRACVPDVSRQILYILPSPHAVTAFNVGSGGLGSWQLAVAVAAAHFKLAPPKPALSVNALGLAGASFKCQGQRLSTPKRVS